MLTIDGSQGEGGGQMLRTSVTLSLLTGQPVRVVNVRARRAKPGLMRQHLTSVLAAQAVSDAVVTGAEVGSQDVTFCPGVVRPGTYRFSIGTAGSTTLVVQTLLPALLRASGSSELVIEGGTHNPLSPPFDFLDRAFLPLLRRMGADVRAHLERTGFCPAGGGRIRVRVEPGMSRQGVTLLERGTLRHHHATALVASVPKTVADRELRVIGQRLGWGREHLRVQRVDEVYGAGNVLILELASEHVTEIFTGFGQRGVRAETVAEQTAAAALAYLESGAAVGEHLADQLLLPLAIAGGGSFRTTSPSLHARTQAEVMAIFCGACVRMEKLNDKVWHVDVAAAGGRGR